MYKCIIDPENQGGHIPFLPPSQMDAIALVGISENLNVFEIMSVLC